MNRERTPRDRRVIFEQLERRVLLSADPVLDAVEDRAFDTEVVADSSHDAGLGPAASGISNSLADSQTAESDDAHRTTEIYFIDSRVPDALTLVEDLRGRAGGGIELVLLDAHRSGIEQVSDTLAGHRNLDAVHIVSHATEGVVQFGGTNLDLAALEDNRGAIKGWGDAFADNGDLLFYGCDLASTEDGQQLVQSLGTLTGADVAASTDDTGHAIFGADWDLEYTVGQIETGVAFSPQLQQNWGYLLNVGVDATSPGTSTGGNFSISHTTSGGDRLMLVGVSMNLSGGSETVSSVTYNGDSLTLVDVEEAGDARVEIWALIAPDEGTYNVDIVFSSPTDGNTAGVMTFAGVDQTTPLGTFASGSGYGESSASVTVSSAVDELVFGVVAVDDPLYRVLTEGGGQAETWELDGYEVTGGGSTAPGAASVDLSWTWSGPDNWAAGGVSIKPTPNTAPTVSATAADPTYTEGGAVADLFNAVILDTVDSGQTIEQIMLTVSNVSDGANEILNIDGTAVALTDTNSGSTATNSYGYAVSLSGNTATITLTTTGATPAAAETVVDTLSYQNNGGPPTVADRVVTLVSVKDSGGIAGGGSDTATPNIASTIKVSAKGPALWLSTDSNVGAPGADGLPSGWTEGQVLEFGGPDLALGDPTDGDLSMVIDFDTFTLDPVDTGALHFVSRDITVGGGANTFDLKSGDVLVSFLQDETILASYTSSGSNEFYSDGDLLVYRPASFDDYSTGTFYLLLDEVVADDLKGMTFVEQDTTIGLTPINAGSFLIIQETSATTSIDLFEPTGVGAGTTSGTTTPLIDLSNLGIDPNRVRGIEFIESATTIGDQSLSAGSLLATLNVDDNVSGVGSNNLLVDKRDVFVLNLSATGLGTTAGTAAMFLDGDDVGLDGTGGAESAYALALKSYSQLVVDTTSDVSDGDTSSLIALLQNKGADGKISLREAIEAANATPNGDIDDTITFNITDPLVGGAHTINLASALPTITDTVIIDGMTQPGASANTQSIGNDAVLRIELNGASAGSSNGLTLGAGSDGSTIRGLAINRFNLAGIQLNSTNNSVVGNFIGTDIAATTDLGNSLDGVTVSADNNAIGTAAAGDRNVISGNNDEPIDVDVGVSGTVIQGNYLGTNAAGTGAIANGTAGNVNSGFLLIEGDNSIIGGANAGEGNLISGSTHAGIFLTSTGNIVQGNLIGTNASGTAALANQGAGVRIGEIAGVQKGADNLVGGTAANSGNLLAFNTGDGISLDTGAGSGNAFLGNVVHGNSGLAVDLGADGVTGNDTDPDDVDSGANDLQNFPVITAAELNGTDLTLSGSLDTDGITKQYRIEFFGNAAGTQDASNGEGRYYLDATTVTTDGSGDAVFSNVTLSGITLSVGDYVTATATLIDNPAQVGIDDQLAYGSTSEFAANVAVTAVNDLPTLSSFAAVIDTTNEDTEVELTLAELKAQGNEADVDGTVDAFVVQTITSGSLKIGATAGSATAWAAGTNDTIDATNNAYWTPALDANGTLNAFEVVAQDDLGAESTSNITAQVAVTAVNDLPTLSSFAAVIDTTNEDTEVELTLAELKAQGNEADVDGTVDAFVVQTITSGSLKIGATAGSATAWAAGTNDTIDATNNAYWTPALDANGTLNAFEVVAQDDLGAESTSNITAQVAVTAVNDLPTLSSFAAVIDTTNEDTEVELTLAELKAQGNEADVDGTVDAFVVQTITSGSLKIGATAGSATAWAAGTNDTIDATNNAYWTPALDANGTLNAFEVVAQDDLGAESTSNITAQVAVTAVNDLPTLSSFAAVIDTTNEDTEVELTLAELKAQGNEADVDGTVDAFVVQTITSGSLKIGATAGSATAWAAGTNDTIDATNNAYWTPALDANGTLNAFEVVAQDDLGAESTSNITAQVAVTAVNDLPTLSSFAAVIDTTNEDTEVELTLAELKAQGNEADVDGTVDAFVVQTITSGSLKIGATAGSATAWAAGTNDTIDATNNAYWTPALDANGTLNAFEVVAQDDLGAESTSNITAQVAVTAVNDLPTLSSFAAVIDTTNEDTEVELTLAELKAQGNEADVDGTVDAFVVQTITSGSLKIGATAGSATAWAAGTNDTIDATNNAYWTPALDANGTLNAFEVVAQDDLGAESTSNITAQVAVTAVNDLPTLSSFAAVIDTTNEDTEVELTLAELKAQGNEADVDGTVDAFVVQTITSGSLKIGATAGSATAWAAGTNDTIDATNNAYWTPALDANGTLNAFEVVAQDDLGAESTSNITAQVAVTAVNDLPTLSSFAAVIDTTNEDTEVELTLAELKAQGNEADVDGTVDAFVVQTITSGSLKIGATAGSATAWAAGTNDTIDATNNAYWTPALDANGTLNAFEVVAQDDLGAESTSNITAQVAVTAVNDLPTLSSFAAVIDTTNEDTEVELTLAELKAQGNEADVDGTVDAFVVQTITSGSLKIGATAGSATAWAAGTNDTIDATNNAYWTPALDANGTLNAFEVVAQDDLGAESTSNITAQVAVTAVNDLPTLSSFAAVIDTTNEDTEVELTLAELKAQGNEADVDGTVDAFVVQTITSGSLKIGATAGSATAWAAGTNDTIDATNNAYWTPALDANGTLNAFEVVAQDDLGAESTSNITAQVAVTAVNDLPTLSSFAAVIDTTNEDTEVELTLAELKAQGNEADVDGTVDAFVVQTITSGSLKIGATAGSATAWAAGTNDTIDATNNAYWTPALDANGTLNAFEVVAQDDLGAESTSNITAQVAVTAVNDLPTLSSFAAVIDTTNEDTEVELTLAELKAQGNEADVDGTVDAFVVQTITSGSLKIGATAGSATAWAAGTNDTIDATNNAYWTPALDANGTLNAFEVVAQDDLGAESTSNITAQVAVTAVNDLPTLSSFAAVIDTTNEDTEVELTLAELKAQGNEADVDGTVDAFVVQTITSGSLKIGATAGSATAWAAGTNDTIDATNNAYWTPALDANGTLNAFEVVAQDDLGAESTSNITAQVAVTAVNDGLPVATDDAGAGFNTSEDVIGFITGNVLSNDTLTDHAAITAFDATSAQGGTVVDNGNGTFTYTPLGNFNGTDTFTYTLTDDEGETDTATVTIVVSNVDDGAPVATDDAGAGFNTSEDVIGFITGNVLSNDTLTDHAAITAFDATSAQGGTVVDNGNGTFTYTPVADFNGTDTFTYTLTDDEGETDTATVTIIVTAVNDFPAAVADGYSTAEDTAVTTGNVLTNDDLGDEPTTIAAFDAISANGGTVVKNGDDTFRYLPAAGFTGTDSFTYTITDQDGESTTATVTLTVAPASASEEEPLPNALTPSAGVSPPPDAGVPVPGNDDSDAPQPSDDDNDALFPLSEATSTARGSTGSEPPTEEESSVEESSGEETPTENVEAANETADEVDGNTPTDDALADTGQSQSQVQTPDSRPRVPEPRANGISGLNTVNKPPLMASPEFLAALDEIRAALDQNAPLAEEQLQVLAAGVTVTGVSLTAGSVTWAIRGGSLLTTLLAGIPAWKGFDPLPVVLTARPQRKAREQDKEKGEPDDMETKAARLFEADDEMPPAEEPAVKTS